MPKNPKQHLQEIANANMVKAAHAGFAQIDRHAGSIKGKLRKMGIANADSFVDELTTKVKRKAGELLTGRPQQ